MSTTLNDEVKRLTAKRKALQMLNQLLSHFGKRENRAGMALKEAVVSRLDTFGQVVMPFLLRSDNGLMYISQN